MTDFMNALQANSNAEAPNRLPSPASKEDERSELGVRFEKMLWAEMLRHTGLEKAVTQAGGQGSSAFAQFMVEAIADDIARRNPLGLEPKVLRAETTGNVHQQGAVSDEY